jgi:hypothetical protein
MRPVSVIEIWEGLIFLECGYNEAILIKKQHMNKQQNTYTIEKDGEGYLAKIIWRDDIYAYGFTEEEAKKELLNVVEMLMDIHLEQVEKERNFKKILQPINA